MLDVTRRWFLEMSGAAAVASTFSLGAISPALPREANVFDLTPVHDAIQRLLGSYAQQIDIRSLPCTSAERFTIAGMPGHILVEGTSPSATMMGVNWYLKYVAGISISWNGDCLGRLDGRLPAPSVRIEQVANARHRFALNDTNDGYTGPNWKWEQWEHLIDVLALHGINEVLVYLGAEAIYQQTFRAFHYSDEELRRWLPTPAHQPWWLLGNLSGWVGPSVSQDQIDGRVALAAKISNRLRSLGMTPVLPGYYGMVPFDFASKNPGARVVPQGDWIGLRRPDWLAPTCDLFPQVAQQFYRVQQKLLGPSAMFKMDPLHEGGELGDVDLGRAAASIEEQLQHAHPGAIWVILGWQDNPKRELLNGIRSRSNILILDGQADRSAYQDREAEWGRTPYAFGSIWNFGGHTAIGANTSVWNDRYFDQLANRDSKLCGIAIMPEASCNNPVAFAFLTELAWRDHRPDSAEWFAAWSAYRYGGMDATAQKAWEILRTTAYTGKSGEWSEPHDNLFGAQPNLEAKSSCTWSPQEPRYDLAVFSKAIALLLQISPRLRLSSAYRYDLVDVARQTISNRSRILLPQIRAAYVRRDLSQFRNLARQWLDSISALNRIVGTESAFMLGPWLAAAQAAGMTSAEKEQLEFDARSLLVEWGPQSSRSSGVHDYANREWAGLLEFYRNRWSIYFFSLEKALTSHEPVQEVDWFAVDEDWAKQKNSYPIDPVEDAYRIVRECLLGLK